MLQTILERGLSIFHLVRPVHGLQPELLEIEP